MNNKLKMRIKSIPGISPIARGMNRTIGRALRSLAAFPEQRELNRELISNIERLRYNGDSKVWYFGVPTHLNVGDQAQKFVILSWVAHNYPDSKIVKITSKALNGGVQRTMKLLHEIVQPKDLIIMQSGHTMNGLHPDETAHRAASLAFPNNRIVFFPTSINFQSRRGERETARAINAHPRTLFLARDPVSAEKAQKLYPSINVRLYPDVVISLIGQYDFSEIREGILLCTRNDGEKLYSYKAIDELARELERMGELEQTDTTVDWQGVDLDSRTAWKGIESIIASYASKRVIVTDRYHGTIFARIAKTPVVVLRTTDHKVISGAQWFMDAGDKGIVLADDIESVPKLVSGLMELFPDGAAAPAFAKSFYSGLRDVIEEM